MAIRDEIAKQAMTLPPEDRAYVADLLEGSLPETEFSDPEIADAWSREIDRRVQAYDRGETTGIDFDDALRQMRQALQTHRDSKAVL
ncbi:MAG: addiction module protein [Planctomycetaceae bacterium]